MNDFLCFTDILYYLPTFYWLHELFNEDEILKIVYYLLPACIWTSWKVPIACGVDLVAFILFYLFQCFFW